MRTTDQAFAAALNELLRLVQDPLISREHTARIKALRAELTALESAAPQAEPQGGGWEVWGYSSSIGWMWLGTFQCEPHACRHAAMFGGPTKIRPCPAPPPPTETPGDARDKMEEVARLNGKFVQYCQLANGDKEMARKFLIRAEKLDESWQPSPGVVA